MLVASSCLDPDPPTLTCRNHIEPASPPQSPPAPTPLAPSVTSHWESKGVREAYRRPFDWLRTGLVKLSSGWHRRLSFSFASLAVEGEGAGRRRRAVGPSTGLRTGFVFHWGFRVGLGPGLRRDDEGKKGKDRPSTSLRTNGRTAVTRAKPDVTSSRSAMLGAWPRAATPVGQRGQPLDRRPAG